MARQTPVNLTFLPVDVKNPFGNTSLPPPLPTMESSNFSFQVPGQPQTAAQPIAPAPIRSRSRSRTTAQPAAPTPIRSSSRSRATAVQPAAQPTAPPVEQETEPTSSVGTRFAFREIKIYQNPDGSVMKTMSDFNEFEEKFCEAIRTTAPDGNTIFEFMITH